MSSKPRLYLDHAATTPMVAAARAAMAEGMQRWANPSSPHSEGRAARAALEHARQRIAASLGWDGEVIFTSGASEAIAIALRGKHQVTVSAAEHDAVLSAAKEAHILPVDAGGLVDPAVITGKGLFAVQSVNNETGVIQPLAAIAAAVRASGGLFFADCSQSAGKLPLPDADMIAVSAHKLGGPPGIGALLTRNLGWLSPSGGQEQGYRRGTENLPAILAFAAALEQGFDWIERASELRAMLDLAITEADGVVVARDSERLPTIASYHMPGVSASSQLIGFDMEGAAVSAGSACSSGTLKMSHVLSAMGWKVKEASEVIRVSFGPDTSAADITHFAEIWRRIASRAAAA
ncbi:cysteine desulfurase family protein [Sphingorhabdus arenilitoris]|uniref:Cysteine desulfurase n=1 Tax=Sphingorhabdus arenilitoris TaxID=1490041 RepID=A0ABV8RJ78_9SPHN